GGRGRGGATNRTRRARKDQVGCLGMIESAETLRCEPDAVDGAREVTQADGRRSRAAGGRRSPLACGGWRSPPTRPREPPPTRFGSRRASPSREAPARSRRETSSPDSRVAWPLRPSPQRHWFLPALGSTVPATSDAGDRCYQPSLEYPRGYFWSARPPSTACGAR